ncbi:MAG: glycosyltransferase family 39 protein [Anaerolineae bacterium]|nr:glycosyltransferase family 39 protein [Anaerolineae bacterium]
MEAKPVSSMGTVRHRPEWGVIAVLLAATLLRCWALAPMERMLSYDEAYNGADALSLLQAPRVTPFLPTNQGRESGWVYLLTPFVAAFGPRPFGLRLAAAMTGILTVAACYALGRELFGRRGAVWPATALAVLYWHVHTSDLALRVNLMLLVGTLAAATLLRAERTDRLSSWLAAGLCTGLLAYTYFSAYAWLAYTLLLLGWWSVRRPKRHGPLLCAATTAAMCLPMALYAFQHPGQVLQRAGSVWVRDLPGIAHNLVLWASAWLPPGSGKPLSDPLGRPILDPWSGALFLLGLIAMRSKTVKRWHGLWVAGWAGAALLPSLLSAEAPHSLRGVGLTVPIALVTGAGAFAVAQQRWRATPWPGSLIPVLLLAASGTTSGADLSRWLQRPETVTVMEAHIGEAIDWLKTYGPQDTPVYFSPFSLDHPVLMFRTPDLAPRPVRAFDSHQCLVLSDRGAIYVSVKPFEPDFQARLARWADVQLLGPLRARSAASSFYVLVRASPRSEAVQGTGTTATFGDALRLDLLEPLPKAVRAGEELHVWLAAKALRSLGRPYSVFLHLYGNPTPYEGGTMWSQGDCQLCPSYPTVLWQPDETVLQEFVLPIPPSLPPGRYTVAAGVYEAPAGPRLPVTAPGPQPWNYVSLGEIEVSSSG